MKKSTLPPSFLHFNFCKILFFYLPEYFGHGGSVMEEKSFLSWFPERKKTIKNSYQILEEVIGLLGLDSDELPFLFKLLKKTTCSNLNFKYGHLEILLDRNPDTESKQIQMTLAYEKGATQKLTHYDYGL